MQVKLSDGSERRSHARYTASGEVHFQTCGRFPAAFDGQLVDVAAGGFRARHQCLALTSGEVVQFEFKGRQGRARAVWSRISGGQADTGFLILA